MDETQDERKLPKVLAAFVTDKSRTDQERNKQAGLYMALKLSLPLDWIFLTHDSAVPEVGELVVVRRTGERPMWWKDARWDGQCWLWEVVRDEEKSQAAVTASSAGK